MNNPRRVVVIGGGFTGLTAALELAKQENFHVTLVEKSSNLGGLAAGFAIQGTSIEKTYHHLFHSDCDILSLIKELDLSDKLLWCDSSLAILYNGKIHPFMSAGDLLRFEPCDLLSRIRVGLVVLYLQRKKNWRPLVSQTARDWMTKRCGASAMSAIWTPLLKGKFGRYFESVSMAWLWARIHIRANSRKTGGKEQLGYLEGGFETIVTQLESELRKRNVVIKCEQEVETIGPEGRLLKINGEIVEFDACIFTGPCSTFAKMVSNDPRLENYRRRLESITYIGAICMVFVSHQDLGEQYWLNVNETGAPFLVFIHHTRLVDKSHYRGKHVYYLGAYEPHDGPRFTMSEEDLTRTWFGFLRKIFPSFDPESVIEKHVFKLKNAQHIVDTRYVDRIPEYRTPVPGMYLANFAQVFPEDRGTNYAVREGRKIARLVCEDFTQQAPS